nr:MAG TPA: hypothetical protein [Caudoviricetes sp.]
MRCLMALTPMSAPARMPSALSVVTMASTCGQPHAGPTVLTNRASAGRTMRPSHLRMS